MDKKLDAIELEFGFKYPKIYNELYKDEMLDYKTEVANNDYILWEKVELPRLVKRPPLLFLGNWDFKIMSFGKIVKELRDTPEYWNLEFKFIPFGMTGGGDWYAFCYNYEHNENIPIVIVYHDDEDMKVLSKNMEDFIFRGLLECGMDIDEEEEEIYRDGLLLMLETHKKYFSDNKYKLLKSIFNRPLGCFEHDYGRHIEKYEGFVCYEEILEILDREINFDLMDKEIKYQLD